MQGLAEPGRKLSCRSTTLCGESWYTAAQQPTSGVDMLLLQPHNVKVTRAQYRDGGVNHARKQVSEASFVFTLVDTSGLRRLVLTNIRGLIDCKSLTIAAKMAARTVVLRLTTVRITPSVLTAIVNHNVSNYRDRKPYHRSTIFHNETSKRPERSQAQNPLAASMAQSNTPTGSNAGAQEEDAKNAAVRWSDVGLQSNANTLQVPRRSRLGRWL